MHPRQDETPIPEATRKAKNKKTPLSTDSGVFILFGVADGARTHDNRNHNPGLYQLSYSHRRKIEL